MEYEQEVALSYLYHNIKDTVRFFAYLIQGENIKTPKFSEIVKNDIPEHIEKMDNQMSFYVLRTERNRDLLMGVLSDMKLVSQLMENFDYAAYSHYTACLSASKNIIKNGGELMADISRLLGSTNTHDTD